MKLSLGVIDVPYTDDGSITTGDVAEILEAKYHVMEGFFGLHKQQFADDLAGSVSDALTNLMAGAPQSIDPFASAMQDISDEWKLFIQFEDITETGVAGVPTQAALSGESKRFKRKKGPRRVSFVDTGLYSASFIARVIE